jgi:hypothetical protein
MKVSSPVGDFPFTPTSLRYETGELVVEGAMGAWPATIRVGPGDIPGIVRLFPRPVLAGIGVFAVLLVLRRLVRR